MRSKGQGCIWKREGAYVWQYRDAITGKRKAVFIRDEHGNLIKDRDKAGKIVVDLQKEQIKASSIQTRAEYLARVAEDKKLIDPKRKVAIVDLWQEYLKNPSRPDSGKETLRYYQGAVNIFLCWMNNNHSELQTIDEITESIASEFSSFCWNRKISERRFNGILGTLKLVFKILMKNENPFLPIRKKLENKQRKEAFSIEQLQAISSTIENNDYYMLHKQEMKLLLLVMLYTGSRLEDACLLTWKSIDMDKRVITFIPCKTARRKPVPVTVPIASVLFDALKNIETSKEKIYVLPEVSKRYRTNPCGISKDIIQLLEDSGIKTKEEATGQRKLPIVRYSAHSFRHTFCTMAINNGIPITAIQSIVGHSTSAMTQHYSHVSLETKENVIKCLPSFVGSSKEEKTFSEELEKMITSKGKSIVSALEKILSEEQKNQLLSLVG